MSAKVSAQEPVEQQRRRISRQAVASTLGPLHNQVDVVLVPADVAVKVNHDAVDLERGACSGNASNLRILCVGICCADVGDRGAFCHLPWPLHHSQRIASTTCWSTPSAMDDTTAAPHSSSLVSTAHSTCVPGYWVLGSSELRHRTARARTEFVQRLQLVGLWPLLVDLMGHRYQRKQIPHPYCEAKTQVR